MNEKKIAIVIGSCFILSSCAMSRNIDRGVAELNKQNVISEARIKLYEQTIADSIERIGAIRDHAESAETGIDECIKDFDRYQQEVAKVIANYQDALDYYRNTDANLYCPYCGHDINNCPGAKRNKSKRANETDILKE